MMTIEFEYKAIAAIAKNNVIGNKGCIPWHIPEDFKWFKKTTMGQTLLMGRKTFESIGKALPGRQTIILSRSNYEAENAIITNHTDNIERLSKNPIIWVAGGAEIYKNMLPKCSELFITRVKKEFEGDTFFPEFEKIFKLNRIIRDEKLYSIEYWKK